jgi:pyruvate formate lyase activating enzyme
MRAVRKPNQGCRITFPVHVVFVRTEGENVGMVPLAEMLERSTREGELYERLERDRVRCYACGHLCRIPQGAAGVGKVRFNRGARLLVPWGYTAGVQCDPMEKKPFFHAYPGTLAYSFGMLGCSYHCGYCQNWVTSQVLRDPRAVSPAREITPEALVADAVRHGARVMVSTYNEPLITSEWAVAVFKEAKKAGLSTAFVSNGNATSQALEYLRPWVDLYKVDLKSFDDRQYRKLGGRLQPVLDSLRELRRMGFWVEVVTLLVPGFNDSADELERLTGFLSDVDPDMPWHVTAFHANYKMRQPGDATPAMLLSAAAIGRRSGLRFVYAGNLPGAVGSLEDTTCPSCSAGLIERHGYRIRSYRISADGRCPSCGFQVPGRWDARFSGQITPLPFIPGLHRTGLRSRP